MIVGDEVLASVKTRLTSKGILGATLGTGVISNGITWGHPQSRPAAPYGWIEIPDESKYRDTNTSRLRNVPMDFHLVLNNPPETAIATAKQVDAAIAFAPLTLSAGSVLVVTDPKVRYLEEDFFWHVIMTYQAMVRKAANYSPG